MEVIVGMIIDCDFQILDLHFRNGCVITLVFNKLFEFGHCLWVAVQLEGHLLQTMEGVIRLVVKILCCLNCLESMVCRNVLQAKNLMFCFFSFSFVIQT
jgi:uncharacterized CHY-type Zn-finger protein